nr:hypothetical protein BaRGS_030941 [Batillaria attramentaria]
MSGVVKRSDDADPLEAVVEKLSADLLQLQSKQSADVHQLQAKLDALTRAVNSHVAFYVQLSHDSDNTVPAPSSGPYKFGQVVLNDGNGYDPVTGIFTAPFPGVYTFALQIFLRGPQYALIDIKVNNNPVSRMGLDTRAAGTDPDDSDSTSVTVKLEAGDKVWVQSGTGHHTLVSDYHTYFTGYLVYTV